MAASMKFSKEFLTSYRVVRALGQGAMGMVVEAEHLRLHRRSAIKFLRPECFDAATRERFVREARILARLSHPNIVQVYDANLDGEQPFLAMEYVDGPTMEALVQQRGVLKPLEAVRLFRPLLDGLGYLHDSGVLHRDLKMANVLVADGKLPKLADFGLAWLEGGSRLTASGLAVGTPMYMSPEQLSGLPADPTADLYAVGMMLCRTLTGTHPIQAGSVTALLAVKATMTPESLAARLPGVPTALTAVIAQCLAPEPSARPRSAEELAGQLLEACQGASARRPRTVPGVSERQATVEPAPESRSLVRRFGWRHGAAALGCAMTLVAAGWLAMRPGPPEPGETRSPLPEGTVATSIALKAEPVPLSPTVERHGSEMWLRLALPEPMPITLTFTNAGGETVRVVRLPQRKNFREAIPLEDERQDLQATLSLPPGRTMPERLGPFALPAPNRVVVALVKDLAALSINSEVRQVSIDAALSQGSARAAERRLEALLASIRWRERYDEVARAAAWVLRPANPEVAFKLEFMHWLEKVRVLDAAARTLGLRFDSGVDRLLSPYWENSTGVPKGRLVADVRFDPPCELLGSLVSKLTKGVLDSEATDKKLFEFELPDLTKSFRARLTLFLTGARPDVAVVLKWYPATSRVVRLQCLYTGRDHPAGEVAVTHGIEPSFLRAGRHRLELGLSTVVGFAAFHLTVHRVQLRVE